MEAPTIRPERPSQELKLSSLMPGDGVSVRTDNSTYGLRLSEASPGAYHVEFVSGTGPLVGQSGEIAGDAIRVGEPIRFGEAGHTSIIRELALARADHAERDRSPETERADSLVRSAADYAERLDYLVEGVSVDRSGAIAFDGRRSLLSSRGMGSVVAAAGQAVADRYKEKAARCAQDIAGQPGVIDAKVVLGAVVMTYDSSKSPGPLSIVMQGEHIELHSGDDDARGGHHGSRANYAGLITVDLNPAKRHVDGVPPTVSVVHELHHHAKLLVEAALATSGIDALHSVIDSSDAREELIGSRESSHVLYDADAREYAAIMGRPYDQRVDASNLIKQRAYLDELHSSFLQRKPNWFSAANDVYSKREKGKHWDLVGRNPEDKAAAQRLLSYMQGLYMLDHIRQQTQLRSDEGMPIGPTQRKLIAEFEEEYRRCGSLIGTSRAVAQAERLVGDEWRQARTEYAPILESDWMDDWWQVWNRDGNALPGMREQLGLG